MGAQLDVSSAIEESAELESIQRTLRRLEHKKHNSPNRKKAAAHEGDKDTSFHQLVEMLDMQELRRVRSWEERMLQQNPDPAATATAGSLSPDVSDRTRLQRPDFLSRISTSASLNMGLNTPPLDLSYLHGLYNNVRIPTIPSPPLPP